MALPLVLQLAELFRTQLAQQEAGASARAVETFAAMFERLRPQLSEAIAEAVQSGATPEAMFRVERLQSVVSQIAGELERVGRHAGDVLTARQRELVSLAGDHAQQLTRAALGAAPEGFTGPTWRHVPASSLQDLIGILGDGSPVQRIVGEIAGEGADKVRAAILSGLGAGQTPDEIVRGVRDEIGGSMARTLTVIRTEDMRSYREAQRQAFEENDDVVKRWRWWSSLSFDTCAACLANHGREFEIGQPMESHPNCRCIAVPITKSWAELGHPEIEDRAAKVQTGDDWLKAQPEEIQRRALGPSKFAAWQAGEIELQDLRDYRTNPTWGGMHTEASLDQARANAQARKAPPQWKPTMTEEEALRWAENSAWKAPVFHVALQEDLAGLEREGFDLQRGEFGRQWGDGVYAGLDRNVETEYTQRKENYFQKPTVQLELRVNIKNPLVVNFSGRNDATDEDISNLLPGGNDRFWEIHDRLSAEGVDPRNLITKAFTEHLKEAGHDALIIIQEPFDIKVGGSQIVVLDPKNVVVVEQKS